MAIPEEFLKWISTPILREDFSKHDYTYGQTFEIGKKTAYDIVCFRHELLRSDISNERMSIHEILETFYDKLSKKAFGTNAKKFLWPVRTVIEEFGKWNQNNRTWLLDRLGMPAIVRKFVEAYVIDPRINCMRSKVDAFRHFGDMDNILAGLFLLSKLQKTNFPVFIVDPQLAKDIVNYDLPDDWGKYYQLPYHSISIRFNKTDIVPVPFEIYAITQDNHDDLLPAQRFATGDFMLNKRNEPIYFALIDRFSASLGFMNPITLERKIGSNVYAIKEEYAEMYRVCQKLIVYINMMRQKIIPLSAEGLELTDEPMISTKKQNKKSNIVILKPFLFKPKFTVKTIEDSVIRGPINCRYSVRRHLRHQRCGPGKKFIKEIWIEEHVKGPDTAPLKQKFYKIKP